jgi:hypothetical protein
MPHSSQAVRASLRGLMGGPKPVPEREARVDVARDGHRWLTGQRLSSPAWVARAKRALKTGAKSITVRRSR